MATLDSLQFEMERRVILFKPSTTMPDNTLLGYNDDPNNISSPSTAGEFLLFYSPNNTRYVTQDINGDTIQEYFKFAQPNVWKKLGLDPSINFFGTDSSSWQLNQNASGVKIHSDNDTLLIETESGELTTIVISSFILNNHFVNNIDASGFITDSSTSIPTSQSVLNYNNIQDVSISGKLDELSSTTYPTGVEVYSGESNNIAYIKKLISGDGVILTQDASIIRIDVDSSAVVYKLSGSFIASGTSQNIDVSSIYTDGPYNISIFEGNEQVYVGVSYIGGIITLSWLPGALSGTINWIVTT